MMMRSLLLAAVLMCFPVSTAFAQTAAPDSSTPDVVTKYAIKSGRLALSSIANPGPVNLPDGAYTNESGLIIGFVDGSVNRVQYSTGQITDITNMRLNRQRMIMLTPNTNALMAVTDLTLPTGTFTSEDGKTSLTVSGGRPVAFTLSPPDEKK